MVDTLVSKTGGCNGHEGSNPSLGTHEICEATTKWKYHKGEYPFRHNPTLPNLQIFVYTLHIQKEIS